jgi:hypothetical protein
MFSSSTSRRSILRSAGGALALAGAGANAQTADNTTYQVGGKIMRGQELLADPTFNAQSEHVYVVTNPSPGSPMQVFNSLEEVRDAFTGTSLSSPLAQIDDHIRSAQKLQYTVTGTEILRMRREYARVEASRTERAAETGLPVGSLEFHAAEQKDLSLLPRGTAGTLWENDNYSGRSTGLLAVMPDAGVVNFDNIASSLRYSGLALFSDLSWYRGSKLVLFSLTIQSIPSLNAYQTPHGVSWNDLISSWTVVSY